jgi:hypothetical protein
MDADDGSVDHLHGRVMRASQRIHNLAPDARPPLPDEATVAGGVRTKNVRQVPPQRRGPQLPKDAVQDTAGVHPWYAARLFGSIGLMAAHS